MENKKNSNFNDMFKPIIVLVLICFVTTGALAVTYGVTDPIIRENNLAAANAARNELLPAAESDFQEYTGDLAVLESDPKCYVSEVYTAANGTGEVITVKTNSYGGELTMMVGIDKDGAITNVLVTEAEDTPGVGTRAQQPGHLAQYSGKTELADVNVKKDSTIQHVTGASVSSTAIHKGVFCAIEQHKLMTGGEN